VLAPVLSYVYSLRAAWYFGGAVKAQTPEAEMREFGRVLEVLASPRVDPEAGYARATLVLALSGFCQAAEKLGRQPEAAAQVRRWRDECARWRENPLTEDERIALDWLDWFFRTSCAQA